MRRTSFRAAAQDRHGNRGRTPAQLLLCDPRGQAPAVRGSCRSRPRPAQVRKPERHPATARSHTGTTESTAHSAGRTNMGAPYRLRDVQRHRALPGPVRYSTSAWPIRPSGRSQEPSTSSAPWSLQSVIDASMVRAGPTAIGKRPGPLPAPGRAARLGYHRVDDRPRARGCRGPALLPGSARLVPRARARRGRGGWLPRGAHRGERDGRRSGGRRGRGPAP